jgi:predicted nucleic acid-binding Zn ribbon protein
MSHLPPGETVMAMFRPCIICETPIPIERVDRLTCGTRCRQVLSRAYRAARSKRASPTKKFAAEKILNRVIRERLIREALALGLDLSE